MPTKSGIPGTLTSHTTMAAHFVAERQLPPSPCEALMRNWRIGTARHRGVAVTVTTRKE